MGFTVFEKRRGKWENEKENLSQIVLGETKSLQFAELNFKFKQFSSLFSELEFSRQFQRKLISRNFQMRNDKLSRSLFKNASIICEETEQEEKWGKRKNVIYWSLRCDSTVRRLLQL
jgi:hypothetical protein